MTTDEWILGLEDALSQAQARISALGTLQVAMAIALEDCLPGYEQQVTKALDAMHRQKLAAGRTKEAALLNGLIKQLKEQFGLVAND